MSVKHNINFNKASFKDFENITDLDSFQRSEVFQHYLNYMKENGHMNYGFKSFSGCGPEVLLNTLFSKKPKTCISLVSNDYLNFTQHPKVKEAAIKGIMKFGTGSGASPLIGGRHEYHELLEDKLSAFFNREKGSSMVYTTGYTANSATLLALLKENDCAIVDMGVHASVYEGLLNTNLKRFPHNNLDYLERALSSTESKYTTRIVVIDGVYSQDGDLAKLSEIYYLTKQYGAYLMVDDAHGIGVLGNNGRGAIEIHNLLNKVDIISGTLSKAFGHIGGFIISKPNLIDYLKFQSRQYVFSSNSTPAMNSLLTAIDLIDEEPEWRVKLSKNVSYFKKGLLDMNIDIGVTESPIIPIKIGDARKTGDAARLLIEAGVYANAIVYPGVSRKDARIRTSLMATHTREHLDKALNGFEYVNKKLNISKKSSN